MNRRVIRILSASISVLIAGSLFVPTHQAAGQDLRGHPKAANEGHLKTGQR